MVVIKKRSKITYWALKFVYKAFLYINNLHHVALYSMVANSMRHIGERVRFDDNVYINYPDNIIINDDVYIGKDTFLNAYDLIEIGSHTVIAAGCKLITANHRFDDLSIPINDQGYDCQPIRIDEDVWIGYGVVVLPGVHLGKGCVVAAGAVVTKSFDSYSVIAGVPAKLIKRRVVDGDVK